MSAFSQVTHIRQHQDGCLLCVFRTLGPFAVQPPRNSCDCLQCDHTCPSVLVKGHPCTTTQPCLPGARSIGQYFSSSKGLYLSRILRTLESSQRSSWALSSSSGNYQKKVPPSDLPTHYHSRAAPELLRRLTSEHVGVLAPERTSRHWPPTRPSGSAPVPSVHFQFLLQSFIGPSREALSPSLNQNLILMDGELDLSRPRGWDWVSQLRANYLKNYMVLPTLTSLKKEVVPRAQP